MRDHTKKTRAPYSKYEKRPYVYSEAYQRWRVNMLKYGLFDDATIAADQMFRRKWGISSPMSVNRDYLRRV